MFVMATAMFVVVAKFIVVQFIWPKPFLALPFILNQNC
jgi:hypothetical protein